MAGFRILGSLEVGVGARRVDIPGRKPRSLLAALLAQANQFVTADFLMDVLWDGQPPEGAATTLRGYVSVLRRALKPAPGESGTEQQLVTRPGGYQLNVGHGDLDSEEFGSLTARAREERRAGSLEQAVETYEDALALWRGGVLADVDLRWLQHAFAPRLNAQRMITVAERIDLLLELARCSEVLAELEELVTEHPLDERFRAQYMQALYSSGRQSDALATYQSARDHLVEETGLSPGPGLQDMQFAMLHGQPLLQREPEATRPPTIAVVSEGPCELPPVVADFVGREGLLADAASHCLDRPDPRRAHVPTVVITGPPGIGKTSLAAELAHRLKGQFPDGQLFAQFDEAAPRPRAEAILGGWLSDLGTPLDAAAGLPEAQRQFCKLTADLRVLLFVDGAASEEAVRPLLPAGAQCTAIITSRHRLEGLDGVRRLRLPPLEETESLDLLAAVLGDREVQQEMPAARRLAELCDGLPGALRAVASRVSARPGGRLARYVARLEDPSTRLDALVAGDVVVAGVIAQAVALCGESERRLLARLGRDQREMIDAETAAEILGVEPTAAEDALISLHEQGLLRAPDPDGTGVFPVSCLASAYAGSLLTGDRAEGPGSG